MSTTTSECACDKNVQMQHMEGTGFQECIILLHLWSCKLYAGFRCFRRSQHSCQANLFQMQDSLLVCISTGHEQTPQQTRHDTKRGPPEWQTGDPFPNPFQNYLKRRPYTCFTCFLFPSTSQLSSAHKFITTSTDNAVRQELEALRSLVSDRSEAVSSCLNPTGESA